MSGALTWKRISANVLALLTGSTLARALSAVILIVIAQQLGPEAYGQYSSSIALVGLTAVGFSLGLDGWLLYRGGRDREALDVWFTAALAVKIGLGAVWLAVWWVLAPHLNQSSYPWTLVILTSLTIWMEELSLLVWSAFKACLRNDLTFVLMILGQGAYLAIAIWLATQHVQAPVSYMRGRLAAGFLVTLVSGFLVVRRLGLRVRWSAVRTSLRGTLPFAASVGFAAIYGRADLAIVGYVLGKSAAGVYAPALTLTNALFLIPVAVYGVMVPILGQGMAESRAWVKRTSLWLTGIMALGGIALGLGLAWIAHPLVIRLYGAPFEASGDVLALLSGVLIMRCPTTALAAALVAIGWQTPRVGVQIVAAVLNVALNFLIIQQFGVMGVARVYILTEVVLFLGHLGVFLVWVRRENRAAIP